MASKRSAAQILRLRPSAQVPHLRSRQIATRAFSLAPRLAWRDGRRVEDIQCLRRGTKATVVLGSRIGQNRCISTPSSGPEGSKIYNFDDVLALLQNPSSSSTSPSPSPSPSPPPLLIDVREPHEHTANSIPTALNLPIASQPDALLLPEEEFLDRFGFAKPPLDTPLVLFCKAGVRSRAGAGIARQAGYTSVGEYPGSWLDWERKGGPGTKGA